MRSKQAPMVTMASNGLAVPASSNYAENGRLYHGFRRGIYMYPCDEPEKDRMDIYHQLLLVARRNALHQAPMPQNWEQPRILDLGCGTGIWAIDMADKYLNAEVLGLDLVNIQPEKYAPAPPPISVRKAHPRRARIPPNLRFRIPRDYESPWTLGEDSWDLIHVRMACGSVTSWPELYQKIYAHLRPGYGWIEHVEIDVEPRCDDNTLAADSPLVKWYGYLQDATARASRPIAYQHNTRQMLQAAGFIDIQETIIRAPYNSWPNDPHQKEIGRWYNLGITEGLDALSFAPFTRVYNWDLNAHVKPLIEAARQQICNRKIHAYNNIHIWTARRPQQ
ncbi:LaeA-like protein [Polyplosphaeria fusca]|uniref:LaeA-like protein n=1 Tax=Polyplosphaeria fusca TaxID=682080 RepID=A0A9P4QRX7_9PLEO|nr:LaeA-like protein [Polyplosphaeria fusca]